MLPGLYRNAGHARWTVLPPMWCDSEMMSHAGNVCVRDVYGHPEPRHVMHVRYACTAPTAPHCAVLLLMLSDEVRAHEAGHALLTEQMLRKTPAQHCPSTVWHLCCTRTHVSSEESANDAYKSMAHSRSCALQCSMCAGVASSLSHCARQCLGLKSRTVLVGSQATTLRLRVLCCGRNCKASAISHVHM